MQFTAFRLLTTSASLTQPVLFEAYSFKTPTHRQMAIVAWANRCKRKKGSSMKNSNRETPAARSPNQNRRNTPRECISEALRPNVRIKAQTMQAVIPQQEAETGRGGGGQTERKATQNCSTRCNITLVAQLPSAPPAPIRMKSAPREL